MLEQKIHKKAKYTSVIVGAGRIASTFDLEDSKKILTHAHAYKNHTEIELVGFCDINKEVSEKAAFKWGGEAYVNLDEMLGSIKPDIVSVCTPDDMHFDNLVTIANYNPKMVICEKPVTKNIEDTKKVIDLYKDVGIPVLVNYSRRFDTCLQEFKKEFDNGTYGKALSAVGTYTKGILHNGSHLIDLCCCLFGEFKDGFISHAVCDYDKKDKTLAGFLSFEKCPQFHLAVGDERKFSIFELDIILERGRFNFINSGFNLVKLGVQEDPLFDGYKSLKVPDEEDIKSTNLSEALVCLVNNAVDYLEYGESLICTLENALEAQIICESLLQKYTKNI